MVLVAVERLEEDEHALRAGVLGELAQALEQDLAVLLARARDGERRQRLRRHPERGGGDRSGPAEGGDRAQQPLHVVDRPPPRARVEGADERLGDEAHGRHGHARRRAARSSSSRGGNASSRPCSSMPCSPPPRSPPTAPPACRRARGAPGRAPFMPPRSPGRPGRTPRAARAAAGRPRPHPRGDHVADQRPGLHAALGAQADEGLREPQLVPAVVERARDARDLRAHDGDAVVVELLAEEQRFGAALEEARGDHARVVGRRPHGVMERAREPGDLDRHVGAAPVGQRLDLRRRVRCPEVDDVPRAQLAGQLEPRARCRRRRSRRRR